MKAFCACLFVALCMMLLSETISGQSLSVNTDGSTADPSALLEIKSTSKGFLIPRMTQAQRLILLSPATSLMVYQTDNVPGYYYNAGTSAAPSWRRLTNSSDSHWQANGNHILNSNAGNVGIGINTPITRLQVADSSVLFSAPGDISLTNYIPIEGPGRRMLWFADKAAFRAGYVSSTSWDNNFVGAYSTAFGKNTTASGFFATAVGENANATGDHSFAAGYFSSATGNGSTVFGRNSSVTGNQSFLVGENSTLAGLHAIGMGHSNILNGTNNYTIGNNNNIFGTNVGNFGSDNIIYGNNSYALGVSNNIGDQVFAVGVGNTTSGTIGIGSMVVGSNNNIGYNSMVFGDQNNTDDNNFVAGRGCVTQNNGMIAIGWGATAISTNTVAIGRSASAISENAFSLGVSTVASGGSSFAIGSYSGAIGPGTLSIGMSTVANGTNSTAIGQSASADGSFSLSIGSGNALGFRSIALGHSNTQADSSMAIGLGSIASGNNAIAFGNNNRSSSYGGFAVGVFNDNVDLPDGAIPNPSDRLFQLGNGTSELLRSNALTILRNGYSGFGINNLSPLAPVHAKFNSNASNVQILIEEIENDFGRLRYSNTGLSNYWDIAAINRSAGNNAQAELNFYYQSLGNVLSIKGDGNATLLGNLTQLSDARKKKNISNIQGALARLVQLNGYQYYWKDAKADTTRQIGLLAQEVQSLFPELVKKTDEGSLSVHYMGLIPVLIESLKEQQARINLLEQKIEKLLKEK